MTIDQVVEDPYMDYGYPEVVADPHQHRGTRMDAGTARSERAVSETSFISFVEVFFPSAQPGRQQPLSYRENVPLLGDVSVLACPTF